MAMNTDLQRAMGAVRNRQFADATTLLMQLLASNPVDVQARWLLVQSLEGQNQKTDALEQLKLLLVHVRKDLVAIDRVAAYMRQRRYPLEYVLRAYKKYLAYQPNSSVAAFNYAYNLSKDAQFELAVAMYRRSLEFGISSPEEVHLNIANIYMDHLHDHNTAKAHLRDALRINPSYASAFYNLGNLSEQEGNRVEAALNFERCLEADPSNQAALARLADTKRIVQQDDPLMVRLITTAQHSDNSDIHFALGKAYEQLRNFDLAWQHFSQGNALDKRTLPIYKPGHTEAVFSRIKSQCDHDWLRQYHGSSDGPVFICGMFRTGSTLLEQILASHPGFVAGGESDFFPRLVAKQFPTYPEGLDNISKSKLQAWRKAHFGQVRKALGESIRLTDKRPDNFLNIGLIKAVLPTAKFVVTERDWRDVATSIYSVRLGLHQNYATDLKDIHHYIKAQTELIDHWESVLGSDLIRVRYEDLILNSQATITDLLKWLGEQWDERCLSFHELRNSVKTASVWQVREPLHSRSIGRWKNYYQAFEEVFGAELIS